MLHFELLAESHEVDSFRSGNTYLDEYLRLNALSEMQRDLARTFVSLDTDEEGKAQKVGYFTLKSTAQYIPSLRDDIPEKYLHPAELACLARNLTYRGQGIGSVLLIEALRCVVQASHFVGLPGLWFIAIEEGIHLYELFGFLQIYPDRREFFLPMSDIRAIVAFRVLMRDFWVVNLDCLSPLLQSQGERQRHFTVAGKRQER